MICGSPYRSGSWRAQRMLHRSQAPYRLLVSGRGVGKTHAAAYELLQLVMDAPSGAMGAVLAPTLTHAEAAIGKLRELAAVLPGVTADSYLVSKRLLRLPGGRSIKIFSADRKEVVRGPSIVALWVDEGALVNVKAIDSSLPALRHPGVQTRFILTTTPMGKNWVFAWWDTGDNERQELFRFKGTDSPYNDPVTIAQARDTMLPEKFAQEYLAEFVDNLLLAFPDRDKLYVPSHPKRDRELGSWLGVDLGEKDYVVLTHTNGWGDMTVVDRWNGDSPGLYPATYWTQTYDRIAAHAKQLDAIVVIDTGGPGGSNGKILAEHLRNKCNVVVLEVKTNQVGTKAQIVEQARADVQWQIVRVLVNEHKDTLEGELSKFQGVKRVIHGREIMLYEGPQIAGEYDDCVISFCLANWGRAHAEEEVGDGGIAGFRPKGDPKGPSRPSGNVPQRPRRGYMFR